ncbi:MAG: hypothetical protein ACK5VI_10845 [Opitutia bacterium]|jgi:hypothetical protein
MSTTNSGAFEDRGGVMALAKIPFREDPLTPDNMDGQRARIPVALWSAQDNAYRARDRQVEENIRMLAGQQWSVFNPLLGRWIDVTQFMSDDERRWRQRPVFNRILPWFLLTHARMTENPPIVTFLPGPDRADSELAETLDTITKIVYREADVFDAWDRAASWLLVAGTAFMQSRIDPAGGEKVEFRGEAELVVVDDQMQPIFDEIGNPIMQPAEGVPFDQEGNALAVLQNGQMVERGKPHEMTLPRIVVDTMSPLEVRGEWGPAPWHHKRWHLSRHRLHPDEVTARFSVTVDPDPRGQSDMTSGGELERILYGTGYYGNSAQVSVGDTMQAMSNEPTVDVFCLWVRPTSPEDQGRYLVSTRSGKVLYDGPRPIQYQYTSPIRRWDFARMPGRATGYSPQDILNIPQRMYNKRWAQLFEHAALVSNPKPVIDASSGLRANQFTNEPGVGIVVTRRPGVPAVEWVAPPPISQDVWRLLGELRQEMNDLGNLRGTEGVAPSSEASGELIKELRFNSDRFLGPPLRRAPDEFARMFEDWRSMLPYVYPFERLVSYAGEDNTARTLLVRPDLFTQGKVNVVADAESMLPEGRGERQQRVYAMWRDGAFGAPDSPQALRHFYDLMRFPHLSRTAKPGGIDRTTAEQENARLMMGEPFQMVGIDMNTGLPFEWYDDLIHLEVHELLMKSPEFLKLSPDVQMAFSQHRMMHLQRLMMAMPTAPAGGGAPAGTGQPAPPVG